MITVLGLGSGLGLGWWSVVLELGCFSYSWCGEMAEYGAVCGVGAVTIIFVSVVR